MSVVTKRRIVDGGDGKKRTTTTTTTSSTVTTNMVVIVVLVCLFFLSTYTTTAAAAAAYDSSDLEDVEEAMRQARGRAKPWLMRSIRWGTTTTSLCFLSPASILCIVVLCANVWSLLVYSTSGTWAEASHLLVKDTTPKTRKALAKMAADIGGNAREFGAVAERYSQCPSSKEKGNLGRFRKGSMAPAFDRAVFDATTPLNTTIGPIETQFGLHLIFIKDRKM